MNRIQHFAKRQPLLFSMILVIGCVATLYTSLIFKIDDEFKDDLISSIFKNVITFGLLVLLVKLHWLKGSLLTTRYKNWHPKWWLASMPMAMIAVLNLASLDWSLLDYSLLKLIGWLYINLSTGLFEEILLRGVCFYLLYTAWKHHNNGLIWAACAQALIFGLAHYVNLVKAPFADVSIQVIYATLIGIGFAGLVAYARSLWPAIIIHFLINALDNLPNYLQPGFTANESSLLNYLVAIVIISLVCTLPGYLMLRKSQSKLLNQSLAAA